MGFGALLSITSLWDLLLRDVIGQRGQNPTFSGVSQPTLPAAAPRPPRLLQPRLSRSILPGHEAPHAAHRPACDRRDVLRVRSRRQRDPVPGRGPRLRAALRRRRHLPRHRQGASRAALTPPPEKAPFSSRRAGPSSSLTPADDTPTRRSVYTLRHRDFFGYCLLMTTTSTAPAIYAADIRPGDKVRVKADIGTGKAAAITMTVSSIVDADDAVVLIGRKHLATYPDDFAGVTSRIVRKTTDVTLIARPAQKETPMTKTTAFGANRAVAVADLSDRDLVVEFMKEDGELAYGDPNDARYDALSTEIARRFGPDALENTATKAVRYRMAAEDLIAWAEEWDDIVEWLNGTAAELVED